MKSSKYVVFPILQYMIFVPEVDPWIEAIMALAAHITQTRYAALAIVVSVAALSLGDALIKATGLRLPVWQMFILRSALVLPVLYWLARRRRPVAPAAAFGVILRSLLLVAMWLSYYAALPLMPLSLAAAVYYTGPLLIVLFAAIVARHWPSLRALVAIGGGFVGVLLIIRPDATGFDIVTLLPLVSAILYAMAMVLTSTRLAQEDPFVLALSLNLGFILAGTVMGVFSGPNGAVILAPWQMMDLSLWLTIAGLALSILIGSVGAAIAYQNGPPSTIASFDYCYLVFSLIWGSLFFAEMPDVLALIGIVVIAGAGMLALPRRQPGAA
ncbi:MAG: DMT family transporter [Pseudomonadota bacterium]